MEDMLESLCIRAELDLWKGRQRIYGSRHKALGSAYILKKDCVEQMERSLRKFISFLAGDYEDKLNEKKQKWMLQKKHMTRYCFTWKKGKNGLKFWRRLGKRNHMTGM